MFIEKTGLPLHVHRDEEYIDCVNNSSIQAWADFINMCKHSVKAPKCCSQKAQNAGISDTSLQWLPMPPHPISLTCVWSDYHPACDWLLLSPECRTDVGRRLKQVVDLGWSVICDDSVCWSQWYQVQSSAVSSLFIPLCPLHVLIVLFLIFWNLVLTFLLLLLLFLFLLLLHTLPFCFLL